MSYQILFSGIVAALAIITALTRIAASLLSIQRKLDAKLDIEDHYEICMKRDTLIKEQLSVINKKLDEQDSRSANIELKNAESRHKLAGDMQKLVGTVERDMRVISTKVTVMEAVAAAVGGKMSVSVHSGKDT